jgi:hypothetical protein
MYSLIRSLPLRRLLIEQLPILLLSMVIAEVFYKFHSFTLETIAFLATWFVLDWLAQTLLRLVRKPAQVAE